MKIYTKTGDKGQTSLFGGKRVEKHHIKLEAYGTIDELNSHIGLLRDFSDESLASFLIDIQMNLFNIGSHLATPKDNDKLISLLPSISNDFVLDLEKKIDEIDATLPELKHFVLPGGAKEVSHCHIARTVCRRAERHVSHLSEFEEVDNIILVYLNRLSDYLFILSRAFEVKFNAKVIKWLPGKK
jgi:cob(I)alamin adenosyltransferase